MCLCSCLPWFCCRQLQWCLIFEACQCLLPEREAKPFHRHAARAHACTHTHTHRHTLFVQLAHWTRIYRWDKAETTRGSRESHERNTDRLYIVPVNKHPPCLASSGLIMTGNVTQKYGAIVERQRAKVFISSTSKNTMAPAVHEAAIVSPLISRRTGSLSVFISELLLCTCSTTNALHWGV